MAYHTKAIISSGLLAFLRLLLFLTPAPGQKILTDRYDIRNGLPSNVINDIAQDSKGYMWFATQVGVSRFDGYRFSNFGISNGLPGSEVECLLSDTQGRIWAGTRNTGVAIFENNSWETYNTSNGLADNAVTGLFEDPSGTIWCATGNGITGFTHSGHVSFTEATGLPGRIITSHLANEAGILWLGTESGLCKLTEKKGQWKTETLLPGKTILSLASGTDGAIWVATQANGIFRLTGKTVVPYSLQHGLPTNTVTQVMFDNNGQLWAGFYEQGIACLKDGKFVMPEEFPGLNATIRKMVSDRKGRLWVISQDHGIFLRKNGAWQHLTVKNGLSDDKVWDIYEDSDGNIWMGSMTGITKFGRKPFAYYDQEHGLPAKDVLAVTTNRKGEIWAGTYLGVHVIDRQGKVVRTGVVPGLPADAPTIFGMIEDLKGNMWLATYYGVTLAGNSFRNYYNPHWEREGVNTTGIIDLVVRPDNSLILATDEGICVFSNGVYSYPEIYEPFTNIDIRAIALHPSGNLWVATSNGIYITGRISHKIDESSGLSNNSCNDLFIEHSGEVWVATDNGLNRISDGENANPSIKVINQSDGLLSHSVMFAEGDPAGNLWIGHEIGISRVSLSTGQVIRTYGTVDGFTALETYQKAAAVDSGGKVWIGTVNGLFVYDPEEDRASTNPPRTYITRVEFYNDSSAISAYSNAIDSITGLPVSLVLPYNKNNLVFHFVGLHFANTEKNRYQYKLDGYDEKWSEIIPATQSHPYQKLPHGRYSFLVRSANCDGIWSEPVSFSFEVNPPFWKTGWFFGIEILAALSFVFAVVAFRERKLQHDRKILTEKVKERTREIEKQRDHISEINRSITDSILYAQRIQSAVLPDSQLVSKLLGDYFIFFKPRDIVSGDFYWVNRKGHATIVVVADCTGHGVPGAFMSMLGVSLLNEIVNSSSWLNASDILNQLRSQVKKTLSQTGKKAEAKDGMDLALCILDFQTRQAQFAGAYNPLLLIRNGEANLLKPDKMPIGIHIAEEKPFTCQTFELLDGDRLYMFSDGYADQFGGPEMKKFKSGNFRDLLLQGHLLPMDEQKTRLAETIDDWKGKSTQIDDILVMGIHIQLTPAVVVAKS